MSLVTGRPVELKNIRAGRRRPGLLRQHLTGVRLATELGRAKVEGDHLGSQALSFTPQELQSGATLEADIGSAGSTTLVLQTVLPALVAGPGWTSLTLRGGTHNPMAPTVEFLERSFGRAMAKMGVSMEIRAERCGFYPAGGGCLRVTVERKTEQLERISLLERGERTSHRAMAMSYGIPDHVIWRELKRVRKRMQWEEDATEAVLLTEGRGPGNVLSVELEYEHVTAVFAAFGQKGKRSEQVADDAVEAARRYLQSTAPVCEHLADQLLIPMALAGGGEFRTVNPTLHTRTNAEVVERFLPVRISFEKLERNDWLVRVALRDSSESKEA